MSNVVKKTVKKTRDRFLVTVTETLNQLSNRVEQQSSELRELQRRQDETARAQQKALGDITHKLNNSSTLQLSPTEIVTKIFTGLKMYIDPRDISVGLHIALDNSWEYLISLAWLSVVEPDSVVLDIGANFGYFGAIAAQKTDRKKSKVVFFEANPNLTPYIRKTLAFNWLSEQTVVEDLAVSDREEEVTLTVLKGFIGSSSVHSLEHVDNYMHDRMPLETEEAIKVRATSIDVYCQKNGIKTADLIKMDIEGYEEKAYQGMRDIVKASPHVTMFIEFTGQSYENPKQFYEQMLKDFGHVYLIDGEGKLVKPKSTSYASVIGDIDDWVMPVFSKNGNLAKR